MDLLTKILDMYPEDGYLKVDGFDDAIIGISNNGCLVYSIADMIDILVSRNNWTQEDAANYFYYNIEESYKGEKTPIFINLIK
jgi:hypothetical protein